MGDATETQEAGSREQELGSGLALAVRERPLEGLTPAQAELRRRVLAAVASPRTRRSYGEALDDLFRFLAGRPLSRSLLQEWKTGMSHLAASTVNVRLAAVQKMIAEAEAEGAIEVEEAARLTGVPNVRQRGYRLGNWLTREQARELLQVTDRSTLKGKRLRHPGPLGRLRPAPARARLARRRDRPAARGPLGPGRPGR